MVRNASGVAMFFEMLMDVWYGFAAQFGSGGMRSTGHIGASDTTPFTTPSAPVDVGLPVLGHAANSQLGPVRPT